MQLSQLVTSLETSQKLKALGVEQKSLFYWTHATLCNGKEGLGKPFVQYAKKWNSHTTNWSAFTSAELGEMLPLFEVRKKGPDYYRSYAKLVGMKEDDYFMSDEATMAESIGELLIYLKENNLV